MILIFPTHEYSDGDTLPFITMFHGLTASWPVIIRILSEKSKFSQPFDSVIAGLLYEDPHWKTINESSGG